MARFQLRTLGKAVLEGPDGPVVFADPKAIAMIAMLAVAEPAGVSEDELLLRLTPDATAGAGRAELARIAADINDRLHPGAIVHHSRGYTLIPDSVAMDVSVLSTDRATPEPRFLADLGFEPTPELDEWIAAVRRRIAAPEARKHAARRSRRAVVAGLAAIAVISLAVLAFVNRPRVVAGFAQGDPLILADLTNTTGDTLFDRSLVTAAAVDLQQSAHLQLYPRSRLPDVYRRMQITKLDSALTFELAQQVAERDNVRFVLGLEASREGNGYRITGRIADARRRAIVAEASEPSETKAGVIPALDRVLTTVRRRLGESATDVGARAAPLAFVTTASLEALRSYSDGATAWTRGEFRIAKELWQRAVDLDTGFAMAYGALGGWYYYQHSRADGERYFAEAERRASRLTEREQLMLADRHIAYRGNADSSVIVAGILATKYPNSSTWYNYGTALMQASRYAEATKALKQSIRYDSTQVNAYINLATSASGAREYEQALAYYAAAGRLDSMALYRNNINQEWGAKFVRLGRLAEADAAFRGMIARPGLTERGLGLRSLGYLALWQGHAKEAIGYFGAAIEAARQNRSPLSETRNRLLRSSAYRLAGNLAAARTEIDSVMRLIAAPALEPGFLAEVVDQCVRVGRLQEADSALALIAVRMDTASKVDRAAFGFSRGAIALARGRADSAVPLLVEGLKATGGVARVAHLARGYEATNQLDSALAVVRRYDSLGTFGTAGQEDWWRAPSVEAALLQRLGRRDEAATALRRFLDRAQNADPGLPDVEDARRRLAAEGGMAARRQGGK
ncbi:MAG: hypothetical protein ABI647_16320 [Gemmatimonadota bacterium]